MKLRKLALAPIAAAVMAFSIPAAADTVYTMGIGNPGGLDALTGPYGTVTVSLVDSTDANITFASLTNGGYLYLLAGARAADVNVNAANWTVSNIQGTNSVSGLFDPGDPFKASLPGSYNVSAFGTFNQTIDSFDGFHHSSTQISFSLANLNGSWASSADVLTGVAMHGFACPDATCSYDSGAFVTGYASTVPIPEPETYAMLLAGLGLMAFVARRRRESFGNLVPA